MTEAEERLARAQANNTDWEARQNQDYDPARANQAALDALAVIRGNPVAFMIVQAAHREWAHPGNPDIAQRMISTGWLDFTDKAYAKALKIEAKLEAEANLPPEPDPEPEPEPAA